MELLYRLETLRMIHSPFAMAASKPLFGNAKYALDLRVVGLRTQNKNGCDEAQGTSVGALKSGELKSRVRKRRGQLDKSSVRIGNVEISHEFNEPHARARSASGRTSDRSPSQSPDGPAVEIRVAAAGFPSPRLRLKAFRIPTIARYPAPIPNAIESTMVKSNASGTNRVVKSLNLLINTLAPARL